MTPKIAQLIIREFHQDALEDYVQERLEILYKEFETIAPEKLGHLQGRVNEARSLLSLRKIAEHVLEQARKNG